MIKSIVRTESITEFLARGGTIKKVSTKAYKKPTKKQLGYEEETETVIETDLSQLPNALKIRYGIRD